MYNLRKRNKPDSKKNGEIPSKHPRHLSLDDDDINSKAPPDLFDPEEFKRYELKDNKISDSSDESDAPYSSDSSDEIENYFDYDKEPLIDLITRNLQRLFPNLSNKDLNKAVKRSLKNAREDLIDEYCGSVPKDVSWKRDLSEEEIKILEPELQRLRLNIRNSAPTLQRILKAELTTFEKQDALQLYDMLQNMEPYTLEHLELSTRLSKMLYSNHNQLIINNDIDHQVHSLKNKLESQIPTIEKIAKAYLTESDKLRALQLYEMMQETHINTDEWFNLQRQINSLLESQMSSLEEVAKLEEQEKILKNASLNFHSDLKRQIFELEADIPTKSKIYEMYCDMIIRDPTDSRYNELRDKILWSIRLPHQRITSPSKIIYTPEEIRQRCIHVYQQLNKDIYGMNKAKEDILQVINNRLYNPRSTSILALKGKPGVGKTKLASTIAKASNLPFDRINLGGVIDSSIFKGSNGVWVGSAPSLLLQILSRVKYSDAVILLDEVDKLGTSERGLEVQHALLHILDPTQNKEFQDSFLCEFPHDLSNIWFVLAMNDDNLDPALKDRLTIIDIPSYTKAEMVEIVKRHTFPETLKKMNIQENDITITEAAIYNLINSLDKEIEMAGMRPVERAINTIVSRLNLLRSIKHDDIPLSYNLNDFNGFPYSITADSITHLYPMIQKETTYLSMYY